MATPLIKLKIFKEIFFKKLLFLYKKPSKNNKAEKKIENIKKLEILKEKPKKFTTKKISSANILNCSKNFLKKDKTSIFFLGFVKKTCLI